MKRTNHINHILSAAAFVLLAAGASPKALLGQQPGKVQLLGYDATVPASWTYRQPSSTMRLAEYVVRDSGAATSAKPAEVIVYFFGPSQGGTVDANLARWKGQFSNPSGGAVQESIAHEKAGPSALTIAEYHGTYARAIGMGSSAEAALPDHTLIAVVVETPKGTMFMQLFGPSAAVAKNKTSYLAFVRSLK